jgi:hypothetical protein
MENITQSSTDFQDMGAWQFETENLILNPALYESELYPGEYFYHDYLQNLQQNLQEYPHSEAQPWPSLPMSQDTVDSAFASRSSTISSYLDSNACSDGNTVLRNYTRPVVELPGGFLSTDPSDSYEYRHGTPEDIEHISSDQSQMGRIECPQGCGAKLRRSPDVKRHLKEQHGCAHPSCQHLRFRTKIERDKHKESHGDEVLGFECGSCALNGNPKKFQRADKLRGHFRSIHKVPGEFAFNKFQCMEKSCHPSSDTGIFFAFQGDLEMHTREKHSSEVKAFSSPVQQATSSSQKVSPVLDSSKKHFLTQESQPQSKRYRRVRPLSSVLDSQMTTSPFESTLTGQITIMDLCSLVEDFRFPGIIKELDLIQVSAVFIRSNKAIRISGAQSAEDMERATTLLRAILPTKAEKPS